MTEEPLTDAELGELERVSAEGSPAPWRAWYGPGHGGDDFIAINDVDDEERDMYVLHDGNPAPAADLELIAAARNALPRLIAEVRQRRASERRSP